MARDQQRYPCSSPLKGAKLQGMTDTRITFRKRGDAPIYDAEAAGFSFRLINCAKGHGKPAWYLQARPAGAILGSEVELETMTEARAVAARFVASAGATPVGIALAAAVEFVRRPAVDPSEPVDLDDGAPAAEPVVVIACAAKKIDRPAPARDLYSSANFRLNLRAAEALAGEISGRVLILSALHGLIDPEQVVEPYDVKMGDPGSISAGRLAEQLRAIAPASIRTLLPHAYASRLDAAAEAAGAGELIDFFADAPGIGYQRSVSTSLLRSAA